MHPPFPARRQIDCGIIAALHLSFAFLPIFLQSQSQLSLLLLCAAWALRTPLIFLTTRVVCRETQHGRPTKKVVDEQDEQHQRQARPFSLLP